MIDREILDIEKVKLKSKRRMLGPSAESAQPLLLPLRKPEMKHSTIVSLSHFSPFFLFSSAVTLLLLLLLLFCLLFLSLVISFSSPVSLR